MSSETKTREEYDFLTDPLLHSYAERSPEFEVLMSGLSRTRELAANEPTSVNQMLSHLAEDNVRYFVRIHGVGTSEHEPPAQT